MCGKGLLVWQNITELLIHSSFLTSWSTLKKSVLEWISQWALEAKCFPYRRKSLRGKANKRRILPVRHCTSFFPFTAVSEVSTNPLFFFWGMKPSPSSFSALLFHSPQGSSSCPPWWQEGGAHSRLCMDPCLCCSELPAQMVDLNYLSPGRNEPLVPGTTRQEC